MLLVRQICVALVFCLLHISIRSVEIVVVYFQKYNDYVFSGSKAERIAQNLIEKAWKYCLSGMSEYKKRIKINVHWWVSISLRKLWRLHFSPFDCWKFLVLLTETFYANLTSMLGVLIIHSCSFFSVWIPVRFHLVFHTVVIEANSLFLEVWNTVLTLFNENCNQILGNKCLIFFSPLLCFHCRVHPIMHFLVKSSLKQAGKFVCGYGSKFAGLKRLIRP